MSAHDDFSNEGLYRLLKDMKDEHGQVLSDIRDETRKTNGRVSKLEERTVNQARELGRLNSAVFPRPASAAPSTADGESFSFRASPKIWTVLAAAGGVLFAMFVEWLKHRMAQP